MNREKTIFGPDRQGVRDAMATDYGVMDMCFRILTDIRTSYTCAGIDVRIAVVLSDCDRQVILPGFRRR